MSHAKVIRVILTGDQRGKGIEGDPYRRVTQYFSLSGKLLFEIDHWLNRQPGDQP